jgi:hypothetical protein
MAETHGTVEAIRQWEEYPKSLVNLGMAELVHDSTKNIKPQFEKSKEDSLDYVRIYHVFVGSGINLKRVVWRFHFDERPGAESHLRLTKQGLKTILKSMTVNSLLQKYNIEVSENNGFNFEQFNEVMKEAVKIIVEREKKKKGVFVG